VVGLFESLIGALPQLKNKALRLRDRWLIAKTMRRGVQLVAASGSTKPAPFRPQP